MEVACALCDPRFCDGDPALHVAAHEERCYVGNEDIAQIPARCLGCPWPNDKHEYEGRAA